MISCLDFWTSDLSLLIAFAFSILLNFVLIMLVVAISPYIFFLVFDRCESIICFFVRIKVLAVGTWCGIGKEATKVTLLK